MGKKYNMENSPEGNQVSEPEVLYGMPRIQLDLSKRYSYADYLTWADQVRRELVDGFVRIMSGPYTIHAQISGNMFGKIWSYMTKRKGQCKIYHAPIDVRLPNNKELKDDKIFTVLQPDIVVVCDPSKIDEKGIIGAPDLVVEVQSPSTARYVMSKKFDIYEEAGVKEYWVVYPEAGLTVFLLQDDGKFDIGTTYDVIGMPDAIVPVHTIEGLQIGLKELLGKNS
jgi:Uma2 family endonuclease